MARATVEELSADLGAYLERVKAGEDVVVVEGDTPIARLSPATEDSLKEHLRRMEREGRIRLGPRRISEAFWNASMAEDLQGLVSRALLEEREKGR
jgi:antitoxin (DNA-binding transcriptional repressor) of toxin-antitoxin stability system